MYGLMLVAAVAALEASGAFGGGRAASADSVPLQVVYAATGGEIDANGLYQASSVPGTYRLIATAGDLADTSFVTVSAPLGAPAHDPRVLPVPGRDRTGPKDGPGQISFEKSEQTEIVRTADGIWIKVSKHKKVALFGGIAVLLLIGISRHTGRVPIRTSNKLGFGSLNTWSAGTGRTRLRRA